MGALEEKQETMTNNNNNNKKTIWNRRAGKEIAIYKSKKFNKLQEL